MILNKSADDDAICKGKKEREMEVVNFSRMKKQ
jgi:hypothetical protein